MDSEVKVSVVIPVYNTEKYLSRCLDSILKQSMQDFEIIIINDQTPDNAMQIAAEFAKKDSRIQIFENSQNMGLMWTRREGYRRAVGEYIVFCDSDDFLPSEALKIMYDTSRDNNSDIVIGSYTYVSIYGKEKIFKVGEQRTLSQEKLYKALLTDVIPHCLWAKMYHRRLFDGFDYETFKYHTNGEDMILLYQLAQNVQKVDILDESVYYYCQNLQSSTHKKFSKKQIDIVVESINWLYGFMKDKIIYSDDLNIKMLRSLFFLTSLSAAKENISNLTLDFMRQINFQFIYKYQGLYNAIVLWSMLHSWGFRKIYSLYISFINLLRNKVLSK